MTHFYLSSSVSLCDYSGVLRSIKVLYYILMIIKVVTPIILIIGGIIGYSKAVFAGNEEEIKKATNTFTKNIVAGFLIYLIPSFVMGLFGMMNGFTDFWNKFGSCNICLSLPEQCTYLIEAAEASEENARLLETQKQNRDNNEAAAQRREQEELRNQGLKEFHDNQNKNNNNNNNYSGPADGTNESYYVNGLVLDWNDVTRTSNVTAAQLTAALQNCTSFGGKASRFIPYVSDLIAAEKNHNVNLFYLIGIYALESGWLGSNYSVNCNNIGGVKFVSSKVGTVKGYGRCGSSDFASFDTIGDFIDFHANLLEKNYLTPGGAYYEGLTPEAVVIHYCPGAGSDYTGTVKSIGTGIFKSIS